MTVTPASLISGQQSTRFIWANGQGDVITVESHENCSYIPPARPQFISPSILPTSTFPVSPPFSSHLSDYLQHHRGLRNSLFKQERSRALNSEQLSFSRGRLYEREDANSASVYLTIPSFTVNQQSHNNPRGICFLLLNSSFIEQRRRDRLQGSRSSSSASLQFHFNALIGKIVVNGDGCLTTQSFRENIQKLIPSQTESG